ncbi:GNAT family N-acetyltransferase [Dyadobacter sp. CY356]|uniref:GNAT family N-acetyltransferase n=1 Tax=Dyadobacter sp. CY356 TaxID=2906442 RepID=UPI001F3809E8|nr:GNAT family N-acetyltransferase [Dyadobacter sp. CY356]
MNLSVSTPFIMNNKPQRRIFDDEEFRLSKISYPDKIDEMGALRVHAWKHEQGISQQFFSNSTWIDEFDENAHHWIITVKGHIVASARMSFHESYASIPHSELFDEKELGIYNHGPFASINRLVVDPDYRGKGFSSVLDEARVDFARQQGIKVIIAQPIESRIRSLEELGFLLIGKIKPLYQMPERQLYFMVNDLSLNK